MRKIYKAEEEEEEKEKLLKYARKHYPIGTKFLDANHGFVETTIKRNRIYEGDYQFYIVRKYNDSSKFEVLAHVSDTCGAFIYYEEKWSQIISSPKPISINERNV